MDHRDEWFAPESVEEQIEWYQQAADQSMANARMLYDLQRLAEDDTHRLAQIRERLVGQVADNLERGPVPFQRYPKTGVLPPRPELRHTQKQSSFVVKLISGIAAVLVIASMLLAFTLFKPQQGQEYVHTKRPVATPAHTVIAMPVSTPIIKGKAAFLIDATSGKVLVDVNSHAHLPIASLAQIMTAVVAIDNARLDQYVTVEQATLNELPQDASLAGLSVGDQIQLHELLYALLLPSGSDAALVIAHAVGGNTQSFITMMNDEAQQLGLNDTHFSSPYGSSTPDEYSSAADLTRLAQYAMQLSEFVQVVAAPNHSLTATYRNHSYDWLNTNPLLPVYSGMNGIKAGYNAKTGYGMVFSAQRNDHLLIGTEFGVQSVNILASDVKKLLNQAFTG